MNRLQCAEQFRRAIQMFCATLTDEQALGVSTVFPAWEVKRYYNADEIVSYGENSVGDPQLYRVVQQHTSAPEWLPSETPALYDAIGLSDEGYPIWSQPTGAHDAYNIGDIVEYKGVLYKSLIDGNTYAPDLYPDGWEVYHP